MLASLLSSHPEVLVLNEMGAFDVADSPPVEEYLSRVRSHSFGWPVMDDWARLGRRLLLQEFETALRERTTTVVRLKDALDSLRGALREPRILGDKYPDYLYRLPLYPDDPSVVYIIVYRDCRAVVHSTMKMRRAGPWRSQPWAARFDHPVTAAISWVRAVRCMEQQAHRALLLRYEDVVTDPRRALMPLAEALAVDLQHFDFTLAERESLDRWRHEADPGDLRRVEFVAGAELQRLGYSA
jgi:hypothetical protein